MPFPSLVGRPFRARTIYRSLGAALHAELGQERRDVVLDGLLSKKDALADLPVGVAVGDEAHVSRAFAASPTTFISSVEQSRSVRPRLTSSWSSRMKTRMVRSSSTSTAESTIAAEDLLVPDSPESTCRPGCEHGS